jgi:predicted secreted protein
MSASSAQPPVHDLATCHVAQVRLAKIHARRGRQGPRLVLRDEDVGPEAVVLDQKGDIVFEAPDEADDGASVADAVAGMKDQAERHGGSVARG